MEFDIDLGDFDSNHGQNVYAQPKQVEPNPTSFNFDFSMAPSEPKQPPTKQKPP